MFYIGNDEIQREYERLCWFPLAIGMMNHVNLLYSLDNGRRQRGQREDKQIIGRNGRGEI